MIRDVLFMSAVMLVMALVMMALLRAWGQVAAV